MYARGVGGSRNGWSGSGESSGRLEGCAIANSIRWSRNIETRATEVREQHASKADATEVWSDAGHRQYTHKAPQPSRCLGGHAAQTSSPTATIASATIRRLALLVRACRRMRS